MFLLKIIIDNLFFMRYDVIIMNTKNKIWRMKNDKFNKKYENNSCYAGILAKKEVYFKFAIFQAVVVQCG